MDYLQLCQQLNIGNTPLTKYCASGRADIMVKQEQFNASGSVKDRPALNMIVSAVNSGLLSDNGTIIEATSGNMGISLAYIGQQLGYKVILTMPSSMSVERRQMLQKLSAQLVLVDGVGMQLSIDQANKIADTTANSVQLRQFENIANRTAHSLTTAREILSQTNGKVDVFVAGVGTGGTISGVGMALKQYNSNIEIIAVEPSESAVLSLQQKGAHGIQGIGAGFVPQVLDMSVVDRVITVSTQQAKSMWTTLNSQGYGVGISSGANMAVACQLSAMPSYEGKTIVTLFPDSIDRYLSLLPNN